MNITPKLAGHMVTAMADPVVKNGFAGLVKFAKIFDMAHISTSMAPSDFASSKPVGQQYVEDVLVF